MIHVFRPEENDFLNVLFSGKRLSFWNISVNQLTISVYCKELVLISKLAPNWLTNVKVIDLTFYWDRYWDRPFAIFRGTLHCWLAV